MARPTKLTRKLIGEIAKVLSAGNTLDKAAEYHGVTGTTAYKWQQLGRKEAARLARSKRAKPRPKARLFLEFSEAVQKARAKAQVRNVTIINDAAKTTWTAARWWLERSDPDSWGPKERRELTGKDGGPIRAEVKAGLSKSTIDAIKRQVLGIGTDEG